MNQNILGDKRKSSFDDNLHELVNKIFDSKPDEAEELNVVPKNNSDNSRYDLNYFKNLDIETFAYMPHQSGIVSYFPFTESQQRISKSGYQRHLSFQEQVALYLLLLEKKIPAHLDRLLGIARDMNRNHFEWCNQACELKGKRRTKELLMYERVTRLDFDGTSYDRKSLVFSGRVHGYSIENLKPGINFLKDIQKKNPIIVKYFFTRNFEDLPSSVQESNSIFIPGPGRIQPINRGLVVAPFDVDTDVDGENSESTSRGVRIIKNNIINTIGGKF